MVFVFLYITGLHLAMRRRSFVKIDTSHAYFLDASWNCLQLQLFIYDFVLENWHQARAFSRHNTIAFSDAKSISAYGRIHAWGCAWVDLWMIVDSRSKSKPSESIILCSFHCSIQTLVATHCRSSKMTISLKSSLAETSWSSGWVIMSFKSFFKVFRQAAKSIINMSKCFIE